MRIVVGTDAAGTVPDAVATWLVAAGHEVVATVVDAWPEAGRAVGEAVASGRADRGVVCCWTGTGVSIAANKVPGVRAALCADAATAQGARRWNDANVLALSLRLTTPALAAELLEAFLDDAVGVDEAERDAIARVEPGPAT
jgi:ribose 5-phosphate isomerase B